MPLDVLGNEARPVRVRRRRVEPNASAGCFEGGHALGHHSADQPRQHIARTRRCKGGRRVRVDGARPSGAAMIVRGPFNTPPRLILGKAARALKALPRTDRPQFAQTRLHGGVSTVWPLLPR